MNELDRRVATLAALFASERAGALLSRLATPGAPAAVPHAQDLAKLPRRRRLAALAAMVALDGPAVRAAAEAAASMERPRLKMLLKAIAADVAVPGAAPVVLRLCRERIGR